MIPVLPLSNQPPAPPFNLVHRAGWRARKPKNSYAPMPVIKRIVIHCSATSSANYNGEATVQGIQNYHMDEKGWNDIGYHFVMSPDGKEVFEGRPFHALGSHCGHSGEKHPENALFGNAESVGICCIGDYDNEIPKAEMVVSLGCLLKRIRDGFNVEEEQTFGHLESWLLGKNLKSCPGKNLFVVLFGIDRWNKQLKIKI